MIDYDKFTMQDHETLEKQEIEYLDSLDIIKLIGNDAVNAYSLMDLIELQYNTDYLSKAKLEDEAIFNEINKETFIDYLKERYKDKIYINEEVTYYIISNNKT